MKKMIFILGVFLSINLYGGSVYNTSFTKQKDNLKVMAEKQLKSCNNENNKGCK